MSTQILMRGAARRNIIRDVLQQWYRMDPKEAKAAIKMIKEQTAADVHSSGKYRDRDGDKVEGQCKYRFPATLFWALRRIWPEWGDDEQDVKDLIRDFPDLMPREMRARIGVK